MKRVTNYIGNFWRKGKNYIRKGGINLVLAIIVWLSPSWLSFFIPSLKDFALLWIGLVVSPVMPSWLAVPLLAVIIALIRKGTLWLYHWTKDQLMKLTFGAEMFTLYSVDEMQLLLSKGRKMKKRKDQQYSDFRKSLEEERKRLIKEHWEEDISEVKE